MNEREVEIDMPSGCAVGTVHKEGEPADCCRRAVLGMCVGGKALVPKSHLAGVGKPVQDKRGVRCQCAASKTDPPQPCGHQDVHTGEFG